MTSRCQLSDPGTQKGRKRRRKKSPRGFSKDPKDPIMYGVFTYIFPYIF